MSTNKKSQKLFGTDGIRGTANKFPMTPDLALKVGQALGYVLKQQQSHKGAKLTVLIGKDTRLSGYMIEQAMASGLNSMGIRVLLTGPLPTPGIGFVSQNMRADAGVVISASHNAFCDNGIKIFGPDGFKISQAIEDEIERLVYEDNLTALLEEPNEIGRSRRIDDADGRYIVYAKNTFPMNLSLEGMRIVLDCANGAAYKVAPAIFEELGAEVMVIGNTPNGRNINDKFGALHPTRTCDEVIKYRADVGISLDGDADRVIMVDELGRIVNGDHILAISAIQKKKIGQLPKDTIVATEMSNVGLEHCLANYGIRVVRTDVGDKYVVDEMRKNGYTLGGEQSGHIIYSDHSSTGDGTIAALHVLAVMRATGKKLSVLSDVMTDAPQVLINARVKQKTELTSLPGYSELIKSVQDRLKGQGRVFVRYSGTEPIVRVLVEGLDKQKIHIYAEEIASFLQSHLGK
ncbi:MAG: phosphoglucosamine mutase [Bdellovibrionales bacterium]|nr:phosphoglucosamine mutase [Bdellovibrionales bacterium]